MELSTTYMGLELRNPLVASASPLSHTLEGIRRLADAGVGAVVLYSLFEEQVREQAELDAQLADAGTESFAESLSYFPSAAEEGNGPRPYLSLIERAAAAVEIPVIASLNGVTPDGWTGYARAMQDAGAAAIELNVYYLPGDPTIPGREVEQRYVDVLQRVKAAVTVPVAVKLGPYFSSTGEIALRLAEAGADALVLFNRFLQPDIDTETLAVVPGLALSRPVDALLARTWIALLHGRVRCALAATTGVEDAADVAKYLLAGRGRGDDRLGAAAPRARARDRAARRPLGLDGAQGIRGRRRPARHAGDAGRHRRGAVRASRIRLRPAGSQRPRLRRVVTPGARGAVHHLLQRHAVPADRARGGDAARAAGMRGRLSRGADLLRPDAHQHGLPGGRAHVGAAVRAGVRGRRRGRLPVVVVRRLPA